MVTQDRCEDCGKVLRLEEKPPWCDECAEVRLAEEDPLIIEDDGQPTEHDEWQGVYGGDDDPNEWMDRGEDW